MRDQLPNGLVDFQVLLFLIPKPLSLLSNFRGTFFILLFLKQAIIKPMLKYFGKDPVFFFFRAGEYGYAKKE
jgi:hypothetical protein